MKANQRCHHKLEHDDDSVSYMSEVNKGAQRIITEIPDQLTSAFIWTVSTGLFIFILLTATYLVLRYESATGPAAYPPKDVLQELSPFRSPGQAPMAVVNVTTREFCSTVSKDLYSLEQMGYVDTGRRVSKLMALKIGAGDVHYVFVNNTHVSWLYACSLESVVKTTGDGGRVNVFVIHGVESEPPLPDDQRLVSLSTSLSDLMSKYGDHRLNVVHVNLEECLECSPFQGMYLAGRPMLAKFVVQLVLLWQFGGTVLDASMLAVRGEVYRANGTAVEYDERMISVPVACHAFVYDVMLYAKSYALQVGGCKRGFVKHIISKTTRSRHRARPFDDIRPVANGIVCRNGTVSGQCYYVEANRDMYDPNSYVRGFCPTVSGPPPPLSSSSSSSSSVKKTNTVATATVTDK